MPKFWVETYAGDSLRDRRKFCQATIEVNHLQEGWQFGIQRLSTAAKVDLDQGIVGRLSTAAYFTGEDGRQFHKDAYGHAAARPYWRWT